MGWMKLIEEGKGTCNHVYVGNLTDGFMLAAVTERAVGDGCIISDGVGAKYRGFFGYYARMVGKGELPSVSDAEALRGTAEAEAKAVATGRAPAMTPVAIGFLTQSATFRIEKARRELGYEPRISLKEGMLLAEDWLRRKGYVR